MREKELANLAITCALASVLIVPYSTVGEASEPAWAQPQQAALAEDILSGDRDQRQRAIFVAEALGPSRMSEDVRVALITLLEKLDGERDAAFREGVPLNEVVNFEFFMQVAGIVATLDDPRAIPALTRVGNYGYSKLAARGLASFGEQALPAILEIIEAPASDGAVAYNVEALSTMVADRGANGLSTSARDHLVRVARESLRSQVAGTLRVAVDLAVALNEPELLQTVRAFAQDSGELVARGVSPTMARLLRKHATDALAKTSGELLVE